MGTELREQYLKKALGKRRFLVKNIKFSPQSWDESWKTLTSFIIKESYFKLASSKVFIYFKGDFEDCLLAREVIGVPTAYNHENKHGISLKEYGEEFLYRYQLDSYEMPHFSLAKLRTTYYKYSTKLKENSNIKGYWRLEIDEADLLSGNFASRVRVSIDFFADLI